MAGTDMAHEQMQSVFTNWHKSTSQMPWQCQAPLHTGVHANNNNEHHHKPENGFLLEENFAKKKRGAIGNWISLNCS